VQELGLLGEFLPVLRVLSFVLLLGNLEFVDLEESGTASARVAEGARGVLRDAASLVQCAEGALEEALTVKKEDKLFGRVPLNSSQVTNFVFPSFFPRESSLPGKKAVRRRVEEATEGAGEGEGQAGRQIGWQEAHAPHRCAGAPVRVAVAIYTKRLPAPSLSVLGRSGRPSAPTTP